MVALNINSAIRLHGVVINYLSTGTTVRLVFRRCFDYTGYKALIKYSNNNNNNNNMTCRPISRQRLCKHIPATTNTQATIEITRN
jgi:hypothetical protein